MQRREFVKSAVATVGVGLASGMEAKAVGEMAQELMLTSQRVVPRKLESSGCTFRFNELRAALDNLLG